MFQVGVNLSSTTRFLVGVLTAFRVCSGSGQQEQIILIVSKLNIKRYNARFAILLECISIKYYKVGLCDIPNMIIIVSAAVRIKN